MIRLYEHQVHGKELLLKYKRYCLFYEIGTGKTYTALSALCELPPGRVLIVAPKRVLTDVWQSDTNFDLSKHEVTYLNYAKIARDSTFIKHRYDYIILDEVHRLKGRTTKTSRKFQIVTQYAQYVWGLTGTPHANNYGDIYNIYRNMNIKEFDITYREFMNRYYYMKSVRGSAGFYYDMIVGPKNHMMGELMFRIGRHSVVKKLDDCVDLPGKTIEPMYVSGMITKEYTKLTKNILTTMTFDKAVNKLVAIGKMHQAANGFLYDIDGESWGLSKINNKFETIKELLEDTLYENGKVIIVYYFKHDLEQLKELPYSWTLEPSEFPNKQILFLQFGQGEGLNLQYCDYMILYTYDYSFLKFEQIIGRIYRNGQKNKVLVKVLISRGTVEEKIWKAIALKKSRDEFLKEALSDG